MKKIIIFPVLVIIASAALVFYAFWAYSDNAKVKEKKVFNIGLLQMAPIVSQNMDGFKLGLEELGFREGDNVKYYYRDAQGDLNKLKEYALELVSLKPDLIFANTSPATAAIKEATAGTGIPVVFSMVADPVGAGFVENVQSSGNNLAGTSCAYVDVAAKRLEVLTKTFPRVKKILIFYRPEDLSSGPCTRNMIAKSSELGVTATPYEIKKKEDIEAYLQTLKQGDFDAVIDPADSMVTAVLDTLVEYAINLNMVYFALSKGEVEKGAAAGYGVDYIDLGKQSSLIANQILKGIDPKDIPLELPRKWYFAINMNTVSAIGATIPDDMIEKADLVIK